MGQLSLPLYFNYYFVDYDAFGKLTSLILN